MGKQRHDPRSPGVKTKHDQLNLWSSRWKCENDQRHNIKVFLSINAFPKRTWCQKNCCSLLPRKMSWWHYIWIGDEEIILWMVFDIKHEIVIDWAGLKQLQIWWDTSLKYTGGWSIFSSSVWKPVKTSLARCHATGRCAPHYWGGTGPNLGH